MDHTIDPSTEARTSSGTTLPTGDRTMKRAYQPPALIEYGSIAELTQGALSKKGDFGPVGGFRATRSPSEPIVTSLTVRCWLPPSHCPSWQRRRGARESI